MMSPLLTAVANGFQSGSITEGPEPGAFFLPRQRGRARFEWFLFDDVK
jgi:hypothetical protein